MKANNVPTQGWTWQIGYLVGILLFIIAMILYLYIVPVFVLFGVVLLVKDSKNSLKR